MARKRVGMLGLGIMGSAMAANLIKAGFPVTGYDPDPARRRRLVRDGGRAARSVLEVFGATDIFITSLPSADALLMNANAFPRKQAIVVETSTLPIAIKQRAARIFASKGATLLDCPLSGTGAQARTGDLVVFGSGLRSKYEKSLQVMRGFSRAQYYIGPFGDGSKMKFVANLLVAIHNVSSAEAVILARRSGLDARMAVKVLGDGAGASRMLQVRGPMMARRSYLPATVTNRIFDKDMKIIGAFVRSLQSPAPLFGASKAIYRAATRRFPDADTAAVAAVLERRPGGRGR